jgi:hypothetical protein
MLFNEQYEFTEIVATAGSAFTKKVFPHVRQAVFIDFLHCDSSTGRLGAPKF